ncbi:MAG: ABC transporter permease [Planctomycetales bacterium]|nr:ABC transporter permease [Planctomycetales bacterium]
MSQYLSDVWKCRYFWLSLVKNDLRARYSRSVIGIGWSLLNPLLMTIVLSVVFHGVFGMDIKEFGLYLLTGICFWNFIASVVSSGCNCLFQGEAYIRQFPAPMAIYPLRTVLSSSFHFLVALVVVIVLKWGVGGFGNLSALPSLIPALLLLFVFGWSLALLAGFATAYFPDTRHLSEVLLQMLYFATPIMYPPEMLRGKGMGWVVDYNPLAALVNLLREPILKGVKPSVDTFGMATGSVILIGFFAVVTLVRLQRKIIFQL